MPICDPFHLTHEKKFSLVRAYDGPEVQTLYFDMAPPVSLAALLWHSGATLTWPPYQDTPQTYQDTIKLLTRICQNVLLRIFCLLCVILCMSLLSLRDIYCYSPIPRSVFSSEPLSCFPHFGTATDYGRALQSVLGFPKYFVTNWNVHIQVFPWESYLCFVITFHLPGVLAFLTDSERSASVPFLSCLLSSILWTVKKKKNQFIIVTCSISTNIITIYNIRNPAPKGL